MGPSGSEVGLRWRVQGLGWAMYVGTSATLALALQTGNNALFAVFSLLASLLVLEILLGVWNLHGLEVSRRLPEELYAGRAAQGVLLVRNSRRLFSTYNLALEEESTDPIVPRPALAWLARVPGRRLVEVPVSYRFSRRGEASLVSIRLWSTFPFGFFRRDKVSPLPAEMLVFPAPSSGPPSSSAPAPGASAVDSTISGGTGDLHWLRPYQAGDPFHGVHWPASAHRGRLMVAERQRDTTDEALVVLEPGERSEDWERHIRRAAGLILMHSRLGRAIGLRIVGGTTWSPRPGAEQRRRLLGVLAVLPNHDEAAS